MSVYICGMELPPKGKVKTYIMFDDGMVLDNENGQVQFQAIQLPPHGRLIDADALTKNMFLYFEKNGARDTLEALIRTEPTIIPAEEVHE